MLRLQVRWQEEARMISPGNRNNMIRLYALSVRARSLVGLRCCLYAAPWGSTKKKYFFVREGVKWLNP